MATTTISQQLEAVTLKDINLDTVSEDETSPIEPETIILGDEFTNFDTLSENDCPETEPQDHYSSDTSPENLQNSPSFDDSSLIQLSLLREEEIDLLISSSLLPSESRFDPSLHDTLTFAYPELTLTISTGPYYPVLPLSYTLQNLTLSRLVIDGLRIKLRAVMGEFDKLDAIRRWEGREENEATFGAFESDSLAFKIADTTHQYILSYRSSLKTPISSKISISEVTSRAEILSSESGIDTDSYTTPSSLKHLLGNKSIPEICSMLPPSYRILHVENVLKPRLYKDFYQQQSLIRSRLLNIPVHQLIASVPPSHRPNTSSSGALADRRMREHLSDYLVQPRITFHGTSRHSIPSIVSHGFLRPGDINPITNTPLEIRCGSTYGRGVYTSPDPEFSLAYSGYEATPTSVTSFSGLKLIVCATVMGRAATVYREDNWRSQSKPYHNADSHVANNGYEYIVFNPRQTIPVLVIHLDWGREHWEMFVNVPTNPLEWVNIMKEKRKERRYLKEREEKGELFPGERVDRKKALLAKARKYFPYGYGPATGGRFVVEDVAEVSDDEEDYGEYQEQRVEEAKGRTFWEVPVEDEGEMRLDEFWEERRTKTGDVRTTLKDEEEEEDE